MMRRPKLQADLRTDVLVIGGGMAGVSSTRNLKKAGYKVALIERNQIGGPATGASSGVLYYGSGTNYVPAVELFGRERADALWKETADVIKDIVNTAQKGGIECGIRTCGSIMVAKTDAETRELEEEQAGLSRLGFPTRLLSTGELKAYFPLRQFKMGLAFDGVGQVHPARLASGIAEMEGLQIYEDTPSWGIREDGGGVTVETPQGRIQASMVVVATNNEPFMNFESCYGIESSVILASQSTERVRDAFPREKILWTMEEKYDIVYPRGDRLILELYALGDERSKLDFFYPGIDFRIEHQWGEVWSKAPDWRPIVGKVSENTVVAIGMGDQGIIMSWLTGRKVPGILEGKGDWFAEFASPKRFPRKVPAVVSMTAPQASTPQQAMPLDFERVAQTSEVPPGTMKIAKFGGMDIMIANVDGSFFALPNRCTHQGGPLGRGKLKGNVVQCPLHGSRFDVRTGSIVGGPAQRPLPPLTVKVEGSTIWVKKS